MEFSRAGGSAAGSASALAAKRDGAGVSGGPRAALPEALRRLIDVEEARRRTLGDGDLEHLVLEREERLRHS